VNICLMEVCFVREHLFDGSVFCAWTFVWWKCVFNRRCRGKSNMYYIQWTWSRNPTVFGVMTQQWLSCIHLLS